jgi:DNA-binding CsgD family transcriptional regulator
MQGVTRTRRQGRSAVVGGAVGLDTGLAALVDEFAHGVLLTTVDARLLHANQVARHELLRGAALGLWKGDFVQGCRPECDRELQVALARTVHGRRSLVRLEAMEGLPLLVAVVPVRTAAGESPRCAVMFSRQGMCDALMLGFYARRYGLTPAEEQVLAVLCEGLSAPQAAKRLQVAVSTVRSHVRSICIKARSNGVRELIVRVAKLPPMCSAIARPALH